MANKQSDPIYILAETIVDSAQQIATSRTDKAAYDKTYSVVILGTNQKFTDDVSAEDKAAIIQKFSIPEAVEEGEQTYYTFKINGAYYCKRQNGDFKLYDKVNVYIPNGNWSQMYIDYGVRNVGANNSSTENDSPDLTISVDMPGGDSNTVGDLWIITNDSTVSIFANVTSTNFTHMYEYKTYNDVMQWQSAKCYVSKTTPTSSGGEISVGVYWLEIDDNGSAVSIHICTAASGNSATWNEIYPNTEISYTPSLYIGTEYPMKIRDYWLAIDNAINENALSLHQYLMEDDQLKWIRSNSELGVT